MNEAWGTGAHLSLPRWAQLSSHACTELFLPSPSLQAETSLCLWLPAEKETQPLVCPGFYSCMDFLWESVSSKLRSCSHRINNSCCYWQVSSFPSSSGTHGGLRELNVVCEWRYRSIHGRCLVVPATWGCLKAWFVKGNTSLWNLYCPLIGHWSPAHLGQLFLQIIVCLCHVV